MSSVKLNLIILTCFLSAGNVFSPVAHAKPDFWQQSKELKADLMERRRILVSVINVDNRTEFKGAGLVNAPFAKTWAFATNPEKIKKFATPLDEFSWNTKSGDASARFRVLWKQFNIRAKTDIREKDQPPQIGFEFVEGSWMRIKGQLEVIAQDNRSTLVVFRAKTPEGETMGWHFAMEAILQRIAGSLREAVEKDI